MNITLPDELTAGIQLNERDLPFELALGLYIDRKASLGQAARLAGMSQPEFLDALGKRQIPISYDEDDLAADLRTIAALNDQ